MQSYKIFLIIVDALHVSGGFSAHHQELKNSTQSIWYVPGLFAATASGSSKQAWHVLQSARLTTPDTTYKQNTRMLCYRIITSPRMNTHILIQ
jgi:hypothetical protein